MIIIDAHASQLAARFDAEIDLVDEYTVDDAKLACTGGNSWAICGKLGNGLRVEATNGLMEGSFVSERFWLGLFDPDASQLAYIDVTEGALSDLLTIADAITPEQVTMLKGQRRPPKLHRSVTLLPHTVVEDAQGCTLTVTNLSRRRERITVERPDGSREGVDLTPEQLHTLVTQLTTRIVAT